MGRAECRAADLQRHFRVTPVMLPPSAIDATHAAKAVSFRGNALAYGPIYSHCHEQSDEGIPIHYTPPTEIAFPRVRPAGRNRTCVIDGRG